MTFLGRVRFQKALQAYTKMNNVLTQLFYIKLNIYIPKPNVEIFRKKHSPTLGLIFGILYPMV